MHLFDGSHAFALMFPYEPETIESTIQLVSLEDVECASKCQNAQSSHDIRIHGSCTVYSQLEQAFDCKKNILQHPSSHPNPNPLQ